MFSLIITIISIALVAALAVATIYYGGDAFSQGSTKAQASTIVNQMQQIAGANTLHRATTGSYVAAIGDLTPDYLASLPVALDLTYAVSGTNEVSATSAAGVTDEICVKVNEVAGSSDTTVPTAKPAKQFGCWDNAGVQTVFFQG